MVKLHVLKGFKISLPCIPHGRHRHLCCHRFYLEKLKKQRRSLFMCCYGNSTRELLNRKWMLPQPDTEIHKIKLLPSLSFINDRMPDLLEEDSDSSFYVVRDDLLHPLVNGNKARKLDAILPFLQEHCVTDVVTCGGCQSAHTAATAVSCAERGIRSHLLLRGEQPDIPTGYNLVSLMYGNVIYIPRTLYAEREEMLRMHANLVAGSHGLTQTLDDILDKPFCGDWDASISHDTSATSLLCLESTKKVMIINEGAGDSMALLGVIRLVNYLCQPHLFGKEQHITIVVDAGTGTTAIGLALGVTHLGLPWKVVAVMLADNIEDYQKREKNMISSFKRIHGLKCSIHALDGCSDEIVHWVNRQQLRKFGKVLKGEIDVCQQIAKETGILVDPIYTLAAWEHSLLLSQVNSRTSKVVMLHTGGTLGMFGLAQRYKTCFTKQNKETNFKG